MSRESYSRLHPPPNLNVDKVECKVPSRASHQKITTLKFGVGGEADRACIGKTCNKTSDIDSRLKKSTLGRQERSKSLRCKILTGILLGQVVSNTRRVPRYAQRSPCCKARQRIEKEILHQDMKYHTAILRMSMQGCGSQEPSKRNQVDRPDLGRLAIIGP